MTANHTLEDGTKVCRVRVMLPKAPPATLGQPMDEAAFAVTLGSITDKALEAAGVPVDQKAVHIEKLFSSPMFEEFALDFSVFELAT